MPYHDIEDLLSKAKELEGMRTSDIYEGELPPYNAQKLKSFFGLQVESHLGIDPNTFAGPDVANLGVEIKATGFRQNKNGGFSAKERLVLGLIDYHDVVMHEHITQLKTWKKMERVLLVVYVYEKTMDLRYERVVLWEPTAEDVSELQAEYERMRKCILSGNHLSGKGFKALDNFPKHPGQFYSRYRKNGRVGPIPPSSEVSKHPLLKGAEKRGLGLKNKFLTKIVARLIGAKVQVKGASHYISQEDFII